MRATFPTNPFIVSAIACLAIILNSLSLFAQQPQTPILKDLSVVNTQGDVRLSWQLQDSADVIIYRDSVENVSDYIALDTIRDTSQHSYYDRSAQAHLRSRSYRIAAYIDKQPSLKTPKFHTLHTTATYDSCANQVQLDITQVIDNFSQQSDIAIDKYITSQILPNGSKKILHTSNKSTIVISNLDNNKTYALQVGGIPNATGVDTAWSHPVSIFTNRKAPPDTVFVSQCTIVGDDLNLQFTIAPNAETSNYWLLHKDTDAAGYDTLTKQTGIWNQYTYSAPLATPPRQYKLLAMNNCLRPATETVAIRPVWLQSKQLSQKKYLFTWNLAWDVPITYSLERKIGDGSYRVIAQDIDLEEYTEDLSLLSAQEQSATCCYRVSFFLQSANNIVSNSNVACLTTEPVVKIPNAFTPNGDGKNDTFKPLFTFIAKKYQLIIVNRYGQVLFETRDPSARWEGTNKEGTLLPEANYVYFLKVTTLSGQLIEKSGNITLLDP